MGSEASNRPLTLGDSPSSNAQERLSILRIYRLGWRTVVLLSSPPRSTSREVAGTAIFWWCAHRGVTNAAMCEVDTPRPLPEARWMRC